MHIVKMLNNEDDVECWGQGSSSSSRTLLLPQYRLDTDPTPISTGRVPISAAQRVGEDDTTHGTRRRRCLDEDRHVLHDTGAAGLGNANYNVLLLFVILGSPQPRTLSVRVWRARAGFNTSLF